MARFKIGHIFIQYIQLLKVLAIGSSHPTKTILRIIQSYIKIVLLDEKKKYNKKHKCTVKENYLVKTISNQ